MKIDATTGDLIISAQEIVYVGTALRDAIRYLREFSGWPVEGTQDDVADTTSRVFLCEWSIIDAAKSLGIKLGPDQRVGMLDVREP